MFQAALSPNHPWLLTPRADGVFPLLSSHSLAELEKEVGNLRRGLQAVEVVSEPAGLAERLLWRSQGCCHHWVQCPLLPHLRQQKPCVIHFDDLGLLDGKVGQPHSGQSLQEKVIHLLGVYI